MIPITKPYIQNSDLKFVKDVFNSKIFTDGRYQKQTEFLIQKLIKSKFIALTQSCTSALEISAILLNLKKGDEVIMPSYGFVSISNAIALRGAKPVFAEIDPHTLNICPKDIERKITKKTVAIYLIHYAGHSCDLDKILKIKKKYKIYLIEDAAHAFLGKYKNKYLGTFGDIGVFSFHETKNFIGGQGGCISINNKKFIKRVNYILDKGTNRKEFIKDYRKKIINSNKLKDFYSWVDLGSEFRASELSSALIYSQLLKRTIIQKKRESIWKRYVDLFESIEYEKLHIIKPLKDSLSAYHLMVIIFHDLKVSDEFKKFLKNLNIAATFHYVPLHISKIGKTYSKAKLPITENIFRRVIRLPLFPGMKNKEFLKIQKSIKSFFKKIS
jgi:dTDP-4-amino-4,6-dideoxygalactose transaminase